MDENSNDFWKDKVVSEFVKKAGKSKLDMQNTFDYQVTQKTIQALNEDGDEPFMLTCSFLYPHDPNVVPSPYYEMFLPEGIKLPDNHESVCEKYDNEFSRQMVKMLGDKGLRELLRLYFAQVKFIDDRVGEIIRVLDEVGKRNNTVVIFTADHGDMAGGHGMFWKDTTAFYDEVVRIPLIFNCPGLIMPSKSSCSVGNIDIMPTILDLAGLDIPFHIQGESMVPILTGEEVNKNSFLYSFCERLNPNSENKRSGIKINEGSYMVRGNGWKYIKYADGSEYLYNLKNDPGETENLSKYQKYSNIMNVMKIELDKWLSRTQIV